MRCLHFRGNFIHNYTARWNYAVIIPKCTFTIVSLGKCPHPYKCPGAYFGHKNGKYLLLCKCRCRGIVTLYGKHQQSMHVNYAGKTQFSLSSPFAWKFFRFQSLLTNPHPLHQWKVKHTNEPCVL